MNSTQLWEKYCSETGTDVHTPYQAWQFGGNPDELASFVLSGRKTATASAYRLYEIDGEPLPMEGDISIILNSQEEALCIIRTTKTAIVPFYLLRLTPVRSKGGVYSAFALDRSWIYASENPR